MTAQQWLGLGLQASIVLTVVGFGLTATLREATYLFRNPVLLLRTVLSMNAVMPFIAALMAAMFDLPRPVEVALIALTVSPVPPIVQKKQVTAGGRIDYVVGLMVAMAVLSIVIVPLTIAILDRVFGTHAGVTPVAVAKIVATTVLIPLGIAVLIRHFFPASEKASGAIIAIAGILLVATAAILVYELWPTIRSFIGSGALVAVIALALIGLLVGHVLGGPRAEDRTVLAMSTASRHPAVALAIATSGVNPEPRVAELGIILLYLIVATIVSVPYQKWRLRSAPPASVPTHP